MGRALSWSLAAHAAFIISFLLLSAARKPLPLPQIVRPVRLVTYLEPAAAPRQRASVPVAAEAARAAPVPAEQHPPRPPDVPLPVPVVAPGAAAAVSRVAIPAPGREPVDPRAARASAPPDPARSALSERLARRLASAVPAETRPAEIASPRIESLPAAETVAAVPRPEQSAPDAPTTGSVVPVGYFPHAWYLAVLKKEIFARWSPPPELLQTSRLPVALVTFRIDRSGRIGNVALREGSGSARFDRSTLAAVQGLGRVPALPEQYGEETLDVVIRFQNQK